MKANLAVCLADLKIPDLAGSLAAAKALGAQRVELPLNAARLAQLEAVERALTESGLELAGGMLWALPNAVADGEPLEACIRKITASVEAVARLGGRYLVTYFGPHPSRPPEEAARRYLRALLPALETAARLGIVLALENEFEPTGTDPTRKAAFGRSLFDAVAAPEVFRLNFDPCNYLIGGEEPWPQAWNLLHGAIGHVHLKDALPYTPERFPGALEEWNPQRDRDGVWVAVPLGQGRVPWEPILSRLAAEGYGGSYGLEPHIRPDQVREGYRLGLEYLVKRGLRLRDQPDGPGGAEQETARRGHSKP